MSTAPAFWDRLARRYAAQPVKDQESYELTLDRTRSYLAATDKVLEVGCGTGSTALLLHDAVDHYTASDYAAGMIEIANEKKAVQGADNVTFRQAVLGEHVASGERYDAVLGFNLFHLIPEPEEAFAQVHKLLTPGGHFISKTVCVGEKWYLRPLIGAMQLFGRAPYVGFHTASEVEDMIARAGFEIVETGSYPATSRFVVARKR